MTDEALAMRAVILAIHVRTHPDDVDADQALRALAVEWMTRRSDHADDRHIS
jgi:hypothetical protein